MLEQSIESLTTEQQAIFLTEIGAQPLDPDLTAYATSPNAAARRALIGAGTGDGDVTLSGAETLLNKNIEGATLDSATISNSDLDGVTIVNAVHTDPQFAGFRENATNLGNSGSSKTLNVTNSTVQQMTMTAACAVTMPANTAGRSFVLHVIAGSDPTWIPTFNASPSVNWGGATPTMNTTSGARNIYSFHVSPDGTGWNGTLEGSGGTPSGTGFVKVSGGALTTPSATIPHTDITGLGTAATAALLDSDTMTGATASNVPSAESVKAYVDANAGGGSSGFINVTAAPYNAAGDAKINDGATMTSGSATLTCAAGQFQAGDVGKFIRVVGAGTAGADLVTTISARASTTSITLTATASTTVSSAQLVTGTDNTTAIQAAINAANASTTTRRVFIPAGKFICNVVSFPNVDIIGAGAPNQQIAFGAINMAANTLNTFLLPAVTTSPIIYLATIYGASVQDICFVGGDGTLLADRKGTGIQLGVITAGATGATGGSFAARRCEFNGLERGIIAASMWDSVFEMLAFNYCDRGFLGGEVPLEFAGAGGPADGLTFISCQSNYTDIVFEFDRCKQSTISGGDFNSMVSFVKSYNSATIVSGVNIEGASNCIFHLAGVNGSRIDVGYLETQSTTDFVWNESTISNVVSIRSAAAGLIYKTASASGYPTDLPIGSTILRYTDATFTTLRRTEKWDWIARQNWERENTFQLFDPFIKAAASPYGSLGWTGTAISTFTTGQFGPQSNAFYIYLSANTKAVRFAPEYASSQFFTNWRMSWIFKNSLQVGSMALRMGLYTYDTTPLMIPANGIGLRADTVTAGDTTVKLEVIVGSAIQSVVDTGILISTLDDAFFEMVLEKQGSSVYLMLINQTSGNIVANQVVYSGTMPTNSPTYCAPMVFLATSHASGSQLDMRRMKFEEMK